MVSKDTNKTTRLPEIDYLRPIVILLLVMMHSFTIYAGGWAAPKGINPFVPYKWVQVITYGCMLESFTFISGYLFGFQMKKKIIRFGQMVVSKFKRLIVPSLIFGLLYVSLFDIEWMGVIYWKSAIYRIVIGAGHLWYLPMLFLCFIITWLLKKVKIDEKLKLAGIFVFSLVAVLPIPLLNSVFHYLPFFYLGVFMCDNSSNQVSVRKAFLYFMVFLLLLIMVTLYRERHLDLPSWQKVVLWYIKQLYAAAGTLGFFFLCRVIGEKNIVRQGLLQFNTCGFGIYVFHQFVLVFLYYKTSLPMLCGTYWLPWCGLLLAFIISLGLTWLFRKFKVGRFLLG